jgi:hypothetical protein
LLTEGGLLCSEVVSNMQPITASVLTGIADLPISERTIRCREFAAAAGQYAATVKEPARQTFSRIARHWTELAEWMEAGYISTER